MSDSDNLHFFYPSAIVGSAATASFFFPFPLDLLGAIQNVTRLLLTHTLGGLLDLSSEISFDGRKTTIAYTLEGQMGIENDGDSGKGENPRFTAWLNRPISGSFVNI